MEKAMKKILVIMPTYNGEKYLTEQLESIWHQQGVDVTVLVRDDGSQDGTQALLEQYQREGKLISEAFERRALSHPLQVLAHIYGLPL